MSERLVDKKEVRRSLVNLQKLGFKVALEEISHDVAMLAIDVESMLEFLRKTVSSKMSYRKFWIEIDLDNRLFIVYMWRGEMPAWLKAKASRRWSPS